MSYLRTIGRTAHPIGSEENALARAYILKELDRIGLKGEVQYATSFDTERKDVVVAGAAYNIIARLAGTSSTKAVLVAAHYDSVPGGPGASDDGSSVAMMLEVLRALKAGPPLKNDVIVLFTDGEEEGLLGARAFVEQHPYAKDVALALNFEARGVSGPSVMFETSNDNGWLIGGLAGAAPRPTAYSLSYEVYKRLPNDTDLTVFKQAGFPGLNFAFLDGYSRYHTQLDNIESLDPRSLQHQGSYALALTRHFGTVDLNKPPRGNAIYFSMLGRYLVHYPQSIVTFSALCMTLLFVAVVILGLRRRQLTALGLIFGAIASMISLIVGMLASGVVWRILLTLSKDADLIASAGAPNGGLYILALVAIVLAAVSALYIGFRKRSSVASLTMGALFWWVMLAITAAVIIPGASYLFVWPLLFELLAVGYLFASKPSSLAQGRGQAVLLLSVLPAIVLFAPVMFLLFVALPLSLNVVLMLLTVLLIWLTVPHLSFSSGSGRWLLPGFSAALGLILISIAIFRPAYDQRHPMPNQISYALDEDTGKASWLSIDRKPDVWTSQFFTGPFSTVTGLDLFPVTSLKLLKGEAPVAALGAPVITLVDTNVEGNVRTLHMRISSPRQAPFVLIALDQQTEVLGASINGKQITLPEAAGRIGPGAPLRIDYRGLPKDGVEFLLQARDAGPIKITAIDRSYGISDLKGITIKPRPDYMMSARYPYTDSVLVRKTYIFNARDEALLSAQP
jgi:hypothetical protein